MAKLNELFKLLAIVLLVVVFLIPDIDAQQQQQQQQQQHQQNVHKRKKGNQQLIVNANKARPRPIQGATNVANKNKGNKLINNNNSNNVNRPVPQRGGAAGGGVNAGQVPHHQNQQQQQHQQQTPKTVIKQLPGMGRLRGRLAKTLWSGKDMMQFFDIPYGQAPIGEFRFRPSVPALPWKQVLQVNKMGAGCPSLQEMQKFITLESRGVEIEDCLRLTVSTKSFVDKAPVLVYIHGDFLYDGSTIEAAPGYLLEQDVVLVAPRYRLGPFGFLSTMTEQIPGNAAVSDIVLALQWVQKYISYFGGDPNRVTIMGQVGGSAMVNVLTMSPMVPDGLFHRVIYQSGTALVPAFITDKPILAARDIAKFAHCRNVNKVEGINKCLRNLNATALLEAFNAHGDARASMGIGSYGGVQFVIGGPSGVLPQHPGKLLAADKFKAYPTMGGTPKNPGTFILKDIYIDTFNETIIDDKMDGMGYINHVIAQTNGADPTGAWKKFAEEEVFTAEDIKNGSFYRLIPGLIDMCSIIPFKNPVLLVLQSNAKKMPNSTYLYSFEYGGEMNRYTTSEDLEGAMPFELGVSLTDENLYLFPWPRHHVLNTNRDIKIAKRMIALWASFAATGIPKAPGVPRWPSMTDETGPYLKIDRTVSIGENYLDEYTVAVREAAMGYNLVNDEFFESLVEIDENAPTNEEDDSTGDGEATGNGDGDGDENRDYEEDAEHAEGDLEDDTNADDAQQKTLANEGRASTFVWIAQRARQ